MPIPDRLIALTSATFHVRCEKCGHRFETKVVRNPKPDESIVCPICIGAFDYRQTFKEAVSLGREKLEDMWRDALRKTGFKPRY
jgi:NAD-dependent SIR2 family protein deacetylase